jgi:hypothetical protein
LWQDLYIGAVNFEILILGFDDDDHLWNLPHTGAFVFHNTSCFLFAAVSELNRFSALNSLYKFVYLNTF